MTYKLSPSKLSFFLDCPLCFWLEEVKGARIPGGIFPSLPSGMDIAIKRHFDKFRRRGELPPEIEGQVVGRLLDDPRLIAQMRDGRRFSFEDGEMDVIFYGALDDCLVHHDFYIPVDFKTRGFELKAHSASYYQSQLDCYALLLERNGFRQPNFAYLIYYIVREVRKWGTVLFDVKVVKMRTNPHRALGLLKAAVKVLRGPKPKPGGRCAFCEWRSRSRPWL